MNEVELKFEPKNSIGVVAVGTYLLAAAKRLGVKLECGAYLSQLVRTRIGNFLLTDAKTIEDLRLQFPLPTQ